ncbi:hypothetical protein SCUCBS95973_009215 [Sporothrix curviconia]|uniref:Uncharacterized protein n=1 Tax=Sporothrix curviconia TaxID=1260050 RepID=A0ABP0CVE8_9PEZI
METPAPAPWVTATTSVLFPRRQWTTLDSKWTLVLTVTAELVWNERQTSPDAGDGPSIFRSDRVAAARVVELVRVGRLWIGTGGRSVDLAVRPTLSGRLIPGDDSVAWRKVALLVETALHMLVGTVKAGSSKPRVPGVRPVDKVSMAGGAPGLLDVAPAVWSNGYFMAVSTRAAYVSLIHRCLASFTNAQSPSLRRKAEALAASPESSQSSSQEILLGAKLEEILLKGVQQLQPRTKKAPPLRPPKPVLSEYLPTSPQPSLPPSQESGPSQVNALEFDEEEGCRFIDLTFDNIEAFFSLSPADSQFQEQYFQEAEEEVHEDNDLEVKELGWGDIEAWSEPDYTPEDKDGLLQEIDETWDPEECENEKTGNEGRIGDYYEEEEGAADNDPYGDLSGESGLSLWKEMQADQIDQWLASDDQLMGFDEEYLDDENLHFVDIDMLDLDEGIGLWQNEDNVVDDCC